MGEMAEIVLDSLNHPRQHHPRQCNTKYQRHPDQNPRQVNILVHRWTLSIGQRTNRSLKIKCLDESPN